MTVLSALFDPEDGCFWLGCNSGSLLGSTIIPESKSKWEMFGDWAIGLTGPGFAQDVLPLERNKFPNQTDEIHKVTEYVRATFEKYNIGFDRKGLKDYACSGLIVHRSGQLFDMDRETAVSRMPEDTLWARGSGMDYALGADEVSKLVGFSAEKRVENAVNAAIKLDTDCPGTALVKRF